MREIVPAATLAAGGAVDDPGYNAAMSLSGKQRRHLRGLAHKLRVVVQVGKGGLDDGVVAAVDRALLDHELVKVKVSEGDRFEVAEALAATTKSEVAQVLGNVVVLYRADPEKPKIALP